MNIKRVRAAFLVFLLVVIGAFLHSMATRPELWQKVETVEIDPSIENAKICVSYNGAIVTNLDNNQKETSTQVLIHSVDKKAFQIEIDGTYDSIQSRRVDINKFNNRYAAVVSYPEQGDPYYLLLFHKDTPEVCFTVGPDLDKQK